MTRHSFAVYRGCRSDGAANAAAGGGWVDAPRGMRSPDLNRRPSNPPKRPGKYQSMNGQDAGSLGVVGAVHRHGDPIQRRLDCGAGERTSSWCVTAYRPTSQAPLEDGGARRIADEDIGDRQRPRIHRPADRHALGPVARATEVLHGEVGGCSRDLDHEEGFRHVSEHRSRTM
jgi:hypothetical protein